MRHADVMPVAVTAKICLLTCITTHNSVYMWCMCRDVDTHVHVDLLYTTQYPDEAVLLLSPLLNR